MEQFIASHNWALVALSYLVAVVGAYVSLFIADYIVDRNEQLNYGWLSLAAVVFGGCAIWAMHFIGMLAYQTSMPATYDVNQTIASAAFPILLCFAAFWTVFKFRGNTFAWLMSGLLFGLGVAAMHYVGMGAMRMEAAMTHDTFVFYLSVAIAVIAATAALHIFTNWTGALRQASPLVMGLAVCGMHYTAMYGMSMGPMNQVMAPRQFFDGAVTASFMGFSAGLVVFLTVVVGGVLVTFRKALDMEPASLPG